MTTPNKRATGAPAAALRVAALSSITAFALSACSVPATTQIPPSASQSTASRSVAALRNADSALHAHRLSVEPLRLIFKKPTALPQRVHVTPAWSNIHYVAERIPDSYMGHERCVSVKRLHHNVFEIAIKPYSTPRRCWVKFINSRNEIVKLDIRYKPNPL